MSGTLCLLLSLALLCLTETLASDSCFANEADRDRRLNKAINHLVLQGYDVERGSISFAPVCKSDSPTCWGNNPSTPYGRYKLRTPMLIDLKVPVYQLGVAEALVFFGCTPPPARYFGLQSYVFLSHDRILFASMGDSVNHLTVNVSGPGPFDQEVLFVTSGDQSATAHIFDTFAHVAGVSPAAMNADVIPDTDALGIEPMGYGLNHSIFMTLYRITLCANETACKVYMNHTWPVLRVRPLNPVASSPFPLTPLKQRWTGVTEDDLATPLQALVASVQASVTRKSTVLDEVRRIYPLVLEGRTCIKDKTNCLGDTRDAVYMDGDEPLSLTPGGPSFLLTDSPDDFLLVVGVLHTLTATPLATYTNLAVYLPSKAMGVLAIVDDMMSNSSAAYAGGETYFYVQKFARHCNGEKYCAEVPTAFPGVPLGSNLTFVERAYINPATRVGADPRALQAPYVLHYIPARGE